MSGSDLPYSFVWLKGIGCSVIGPGEHREIFHIPETIGFVRAMKNKCDALNDAFEAGRRSRDGLRSALDLISRVRKQILKIDPFDIETALLVADVAINSDEWGDPWEKDEMEQVMVG